jgi:predicted membrane protein
MKKRFVISNTPVKFPIQSTILYTFLLYHFQVSGIWWGIFITLYSLYWIIAIVAKWNEESIDLNSDKLDEKKKVVESKFAQRLQKLMNERSV